MPQITTINIRRFKLLEALDLPLSDVTVLVGSNNAGKSSVLQAIHFAVALAQTSRLAGRVSWRKDTFQLSLNPAQLMYSPVSDVLTLATGGQLKEGSPTQIEVEFIDDGGQKCLVSLRRGRNRNIAVRLEGRAIGELLQDIQKPFSVYAPGLAGIPREEHYLSPGVLRRIVARGDANLVLRNVLYLLSQDKDAWEQFLEWIRAVFPALQLRIRFNRETDENIRALFALDGGPFLPVDSAGTSVLQACQLFAYIALFHPRILILDEPDSHLHPDNQRKLLAAIQAITIEQDLQVIISTHSRHVLDALRHKAKLIWLSKGAIVQAPDPPTMRVLLDIGALDSVDFFANGQIKCIVATEDTDAEPMRAVLLSNGFLDEETYIASYSGVTKAEAAEVLGQFLADKAPNVTTIVHRDRDYLPDAGIQRYEAHLRDRNLHPFIPAGNDIESLFLNSAHLAELNPALTPAKIDELIRQAVELTRDQTVKAIVNSRTDEAFRIRREGGPPPDHGEIALQAQREFEADPIAAARGKVTLPRLAGLLQDRLGARPLIFRPTEHLIQAPLQELAARMWPKV